MSDSTDDSELLARLQAADPATRAPLPSEHWIRDLTEATMNDRTGDPSARRWTWPVAAAAAVLVAGIGGYALNSGLGDGGPTPSVASGQPSEVPTVTRLDVPSPSAAKCVVPSAATLKTAEIAFDATVASIAGDQVTLGVTHWYAGPPTDQVVVRAPSEDLRALLIGVEFEQGKRYLVAANGGQVTVCGFSGAYDNTLAALYAEAFGG